ncbi:MAG: response regulator [Candidatus Omnitrophota bacterium]
MRKKKILIIDDEEDFLKLTKIYLEKVGKYEVMTESSGKAGVAAAVQFKPDLIFLDILIPDMEGADIAAKIKDDIRAKDIPIVFLSAVVTNQEVSSHGGFIGGYPCIAKPIDAKDLIDYIEKNVK